MQYLYENQGIDFDDVRADIVRYFGPGHSVTIHDGDAFTLFDTIPGFYCAGTIRGSHGHTVATFATDYVTDPTDDSNMRPTLSDYILVHRDIGAEARSTSLRSMSGSTGYVVAGSLLDGCSIRTGRRQGTAKAGAVPRLRNQVVYQQR